MYRLYTHTGNDKQGQNETVCSGGKRQVTIETGGQMCESSRQLMYEINIVSHLKEKIIKFNICLVSFGN